jgi:hypothetical protein
MDKIQNLDKENSFMLKLIVAEEIPHPSRLASRGGGHFPIGHKSGRGNENKKRKRKNY